MSTPRPEVITSPLPAREPSVIFAPLPTDWVGRIKWTTLARVIALSALLMFGLAMDLGMGPQGLTRVPEVVLYQVVTTFFVLSFIALLGTYLLADRFAAWLAWATLAIDVTLAAVMVAITHGTDSVFLFAMPLAVLSGAALLERTGAFVAASACTLMLTAVALIDLQVFGIEMEQYTAGWLRSLGPRNTPQPFGVLVTMFVQIAALYGTALLSSKFVAELARARAREESERRELAALRVRYEDVVSSLPGGLATVSNSGTITSCNPAFSRILGLERSDVIGSQVADVLPELHANEAASTTVEIARGDIEKLDVEAPDEITRDRAGRAQILAVKTAVLHGGVRNDGTIVLLRDVTEVRRREQEHRSRERLAAVGEMAMAVAHEIRNPLASISGTVQMLQAMGQPDDGADELMKIAVRETRHLSSWIGDFLDFARPGDKQLSRCDLLQIVKEKVMAFQQDPRVGAHDVTIELQADDTDDYGLEADDTKLASVVWNLLTNARQAVLEVERRHIAVHLAAASSYLQLRVMDSGPGVAAEIRPHIFEPFYTTKGEGTGLGLALVRRIVELHGGTIELSGATGAGAEFVVTLPRTAERSSVHAPTAMNTLPA